VTRRSSPSWAIIASLERPVPLLGRSLRELPDLAQAASPIDLQATPAASVAGAHRRAVARSATLAAHYWDTADPDTRPRAVAVHTEIAQIAALAEGLAAVGQALAQHLRAAGRNGTALDFARRTSRRSGSSRPPPDARRSRRRA